ncbi:MAG: hypothetical protein IKX59_05850 [Bacteroidales bacterium]|nr:hypothetical protein [Bacteroidales bacterium]
MKKVFAILIGLSLMTSAFAVETNFESDENQVTDPTVVSDEESWVDEAGDEIEDVRDVIDDVIEEDPLERFNYGNDYRNDELVILILFLFALFFIGVSTGLYVLVAVMAMNRHRNAAVWVFLSIVLTPLLGIIILLLLGKSDPLKPELLYNKQESGR